MSSFARKTTLICALGLLAMVRVEPAFAHPNIGAIAPAPANVQSAGEIGTQVAGLGVADSTALRFIVQNGLHKNLSLLLLHDVKDSALVRAAIKRYGMDKVQGTVVSAIRTAHSHHAKDWNSVMADSYAAHFEASELRSLLLERDGSPYFGRLVDLQPVISAEVRQSGAGVIAAARAEVLDQLATALPL